MPTGILMLAAGSGERFGGDKRLATLADGRFLLQASAQGALDSGLPLVVCLRPRDTSLAAELQAMGAAICFCDSAAEGMGATLAEGMRAIAGWDGVLVALGDMPDLAAQTYRQVARGLAEAPICRPCWRGRPGHPVGFARRFFPALRQLRGDRGARDILREHRELILEIPVDDPGTLRDVDAPGDLG